MAKDKGYTKRVDTSSGLGSVIENTTSKQSQASDLLYGKKNYMLILTGLGLMFLGLALMAGGHMPSPDVWDESLIYSPIRITVAPMIILIGLGVEVYAIFAKK
ncbi:MAG: DUF3098 domain-containing protein [Saprospiraceae bacterium]|nr:DUF3098 domain-containing protein [Saprospiraceae bacterium]